LITQSSCNSFTLNNQTYTQSGTYTQNFTNSLGCDSIITLNLTINQPSTSTLNETACVSYAMNGQTYTQSGTYTQTILNTAGCDSIITLNLSINQPPTASTTVSNTTFHAASDGVADLTVSGSAPFSYVWSNGATTEDLNNIAAGSYTVTVIDANGCTTTATATVNQPPLSVVQNNLKIGVNVIPNPFSNTALLKLEGLEYTDNLELEIYNLNGQRIQFLNDTQNGQFQLSRGEMSQGIYFFSVRQNGKVVARGKMVVE
jgi:hypothetical protein